MSPRPSRLTPEDRAFVRRWVGATAVDESGDRVGEVEDIYTDDDTGEPAWLVVNTQWQLGMVTLVPFAAASAQGSGLLVAVSADLVRQAPHWQLTGHLDRGRVEELRRYYAQADEIGPWTSEPEAAGPARSGPSGHHTQLPTPRPSAPSPSYRDDRGPRPAPAPAEAWDDDDDFDARASAPRSQPAPGPGEAGSGPRPGGRSWWGESIEAPRPPGRAT